MEIYNQLEAAAPNINGSTAAATIDYAFNWRTKYGGFTFGSYSIDSAWVNLNIIYTFPRWKDYSSYPDDELRSQWDEFHAALEEHEDGHKGIVMYHARQLTNLLQNYSEDDRDLFTEILREKANRIIDACSYKNDRYDKETAHGKNQGGVWLIK